MIEISKFLLVLLCCFTLSCKEDNHRNKPFVYGEINKITIDMVKKKRDYCRFSRVYLELHIWSDRDTIFNLKSSYSAGCDFDRESGLVYKLNNITLPTIVLAEDTIVTVRLNKNIPNRLALTIQQGITPKNLLKNELSIEDLKKSLKETDWFFQLINSDSLNYSEIISANSTTKLHIKPSSKMRVEYFFDNRKIEKRFFYKKEFEIGPPPDMLNLK